jgi:hypothetical protein
VAGNVGNTSSSLNICLGLGDNLVQPINGLLIRSAQPVAHRGRNNHLPISWSLHQTPRWCSDEAVVSEASLRGATWIRRRNGSSTIATLFHTHIAVSTAIVVGFDLELDPSTRNGLPTLDSALERQGQGNEKGLSRLEGRAIGIERVVEVCTSSSDAVPVVVVEEVGLGLVGLVDQIDTSRLLTGLKRGCIGTSCEESNERDELLVLHLEWIPNIYGGICLWKKEIRGIYKYVKAYPLRI